MDHQSIIIRTPHGRFRGGIYKTTVAPTLTANDWKDNNHVVEMAEQKLFRTLI